MAGLVVRVLVLSIFGLLATVVANIEKDELIAAALLFRHGDRAPLKSFPNDKYFDEKYWPKGFGQLLNKCVETCSRAIYLKLILRNTILCNYMQRGNTPKCNNITLTSNKARENEETCTNITVISTVPDETALHWRLRTLFNDEAGKYRAYQLGKYLRQRYNTFISDQYKSEEIYVISSDIDRAIMTADSLLAGLYPPTKEDTWLKDMLWQPIPVHSIPSEIDNVIQMKANCPKYGTLFRNITQMEVFAQLMERYSDIFDTISAKSGWSNVDIDTVKSLVGTMYVYSKHDASYIPEWYTRLDQRSLKYIAGLSFAMPTYTKEIQRLRSGPFFYYLINYLDGVIKGEKPKLLLMSGHDTTVASILSTLDCYNYEPPEFTATIFWEVYRTKSGKHYINLLYKKNSESEAELIKVDNCKSNVTYDDFKAAVSPILTSGEQWRHDCFVSATAAGTSRVHFSVLLMSVVLLISNKYL